MTTGSGTTTVRFTYDAFGRRTAKTVVTTPTSGPVVTTTTTYVYDGEDVIWEEVITDASGVPVTAMTRYVHGPGIHEPLLIEHGGQPYAVHADALGSVTGLSAASQTVVEASRYTSFGELTRSGGVAGNPYAFTGREWEPELELYYYRARYYDPAAGRFLSRDPIRIVEGFTNPYLYVEGNPVNLVDPSGLISRTPKIDGYAIRIYANDADTTKWPGGWHGHDKSKGIVVDIEGNIYNEATRKTVGQLSKQGKIRWQAVLEQLGKSQPAAPRSYGPKLRAVCGLGLLSDIMIDVNRLHRAREAGRTFRQQEEFELRGAGPYIWTPLGLMENPYHRRPYD